jgi:hypothetical protein
MIWYIENWRSKIATYSPAGQIPSHFNPIYVTKTYLDDARTVLKWILRKYSERTGFIWLRIWTDGGTL